MLRHYLLGRYVDLKDVEDILGHSPFIYLRGVLVYSVLLFLVYVAYAISQQYPEYQNVPYVKRIAGILWLFIFFKWLLGFLNLYLDCILISKDALTVFLRDGILEYKTEVIDRSKILVISHKYDLDKIKSTVRDIWEGQSIKTDIRTLKIENNGAEIIEG